MNRDLIIANASELVTCTGDGLGIVSNGWLFVKEGLIQAVGDKEHVLSHLSEGERERIKFVDAAGKTVLPGFVDCHTHVVFGGDRVEEDAGRIGGESTAEMKRRGVCVGMACSVERTRAASPEELFLQSSVRLEQMISNGSTTIECKSGYGLSLERELLQLETIKKLSSDSVDLFPTFLGAHGWPEGESKERYIDRLVEEIIPTVAEKQLACFCDIWVDEGFFTAADARRILSAGLNYKLRPKIHAEAYSYVGASDVAIELGAVSSDHLNYTPYDVLKHFRDKEVTPVILPCTDFVVRHPHPVAPRPMLELGLPVAVATNCNPGCYCTSMPFALQLAARVHGLSITEALRAGTVNGARALGLSDRGSLGVGQIADIQIWGEPRHEMMFYRLGGQWVETVYKRGKKIYEKRGIQ